MWARVVTTLLKFRNTFVVYVRSVLVNLVYL